MIETGASSGFPPFIQKLLAARGLATRAEQLAFLTPKLKDLRDPFLFRDMEKAVERLLLARTSGEEVAIYGDFDLDGTTAAALLETGLSALGFSKLTIVQPKRLSEGYGVHLHLIDQLHARGVKVIVTVDVGITALAAAERCLELGIDFIVTDHHLPGSQLPRAFALINANSGVCPSGLQMLSGVGVAFYLVLALRKRIREREGDASLQGFDPKELLDCLVIGTLTDMTPLIDENRVLMKHGLLQLAKTKRPALALLIQKLVGVRALSSQDVGFMIAPKLNALSRLEMGLTPLEILRCTDPALAEDLIETVLELNDSRRNLQAEALVHARATHETSGETSHVWVWNKEYHKGVLGLIATQLAREFGVPAFVGAISGEEGSEQYVVGSGRLPDGSTLSLLDLFEAAQGILIQSGGHREAGGFKVLANRAIELREIWNVYIQNQLSSHGPSAAPLDLFEIETTLEDLAHAQVLSALDLLEPFGKAWPVPLVAICATIAERRELKGGHLKFTLAEGLVKIEALAFNPSADLACLTLGEVVQLVVEPQKNTWGGRERLQLLIRRIL